MAVHVNAGTASQPRLFRRQIVSGFTEPTSRLLKKYTCLSSEPSPGIVQGPQTLGQRRQHSGGRDPCVTPIGVRQREGA